MPGIVFENSDGLFETLICVNQYLLADDAKITFSIKFVQTIFKLITKDNFQECKELR
jgi:hypothetical protein